MKEKYNWHQQCIVSPAVVLRWPFTDTCCTNPAYFMCCRKGGAFWVQWVRASTWRLHCRQSSQSFQLVPGSGISECVCKERFSNIEIALAFRGASRGTVGRIPHLERMLMCLECGALAALSPGACTQFLFQSSIWASRINSQGGLNTPAPWWVHGNFA